MEVTRPSMMNSHCQPRSPPRPSMYSSPAARGAPMTCARRDCPSDILPASSDWTDRLAFCHTQQTSILNACGRIAYFLRHMPGLGTSVTGDAVSGVDQQSLCAGQDGQHRQVKEVKGPKLLIILETDERR